MIAKQDEVGFNFTWLNDTEDDFSLAWAGVEPILLEPDLPSGPYSIELSNMELALTVNGNSEIVLKWTPNGSSYLIAQNYGEGWQPIAGRFPVNKENYTIFFVLNEDGILIVGTIDIEVESPN